MVRSFLLPGLLALAGLLLTFPGAAQGVDYLPLPASPTPMPPQPACVGRVIDARAQRLSIGTGGLSATSKPALITFHDGLPATLQHFLAQEKPGRPGVPQLVMRVTGLETARVPSSNLIPAYTATASLVADFYAPQPDSSYRLVAHYAQSMAQQLDREVVLRFQQLLGDLLRQAGELSIAHATEVAGPSYPAGYVLAPQPQPAELLPLLNPAVPPQAGFYYTLPELWSNRPGRPDQPEVEQQPYENAEWGNEPEVKPYYHNAQGQRVPATNALAFSDGQSLYWQVNTHFYKLVRRGQGFVFYGRAGDDSSYRFAALTRYTSILHPSVVTLLASVALATPLLERRAQFSFSPLTGNSILEPSTADAPAAARPTHLFVYRPRNAKGPAVRIRLAPDQPAQELVAGDYLSFEPASDQPLQVTLLPAIGPEAQLAIMPTADAPIYLECRPGKAPSLRRVADKAGAAALNQLAK